MISEKFNLKGVLYKQLRLSLTVTQAEAWIWRSSKFVANIAY